MTPSNYDVTAYLGADFDDSVTWTDSNGDPVDLTSYTFLCQVRKAPGDTLLVTIEVTAPTPSNGVMLLHVDAANLEGVPVGVWQWDLFVTAGTGEKYKLLYGSFTVTDRISTE